MDKHSSQDLLSMGDWIFPTAKRLCGNPCSGSLTMEGPISTTWYCRWSYHIPFIKEEAVFCLNQNKSYLLGFHFLLVMFLKAASAMRHKHANLWPQYQWLLGNKSGDLILTDKLLLHITCYPQRLGLIRKQTKA